MKKVFQIQQERIKPDRAVDSIKNELRKYVKREKKKDLPNKKTMYWDFDCKFGKTADLASACTFDEISTQLNTVVKDSWESCYVEVMAKAVDKPEKEESEEE